MAVKTQPGQWCPACEREVAGQRQTHGLRNAAAVNGVLVTAGLSLFALKRSEKKLTCPICGTPTRNSKPGPPMAPVTVVDRPVTPQVRYV